MLNVFVFAYRHFTSSWCGSRSSYKGTSFKRHTITSTSASTITSNSSLPETTSEEQLVHQIAGAVTRALNFLHYAWPVCSPGTQHQPDSLPSVKKSVSEAIQHKTGPNQAAETSTDGRCTKSPFISVATPLGSLVSTKIKNKIWGNEYIDLGLLLNVQPSNETYGVKLHKTGEDNLLPQFLTRKCCQSPT